MKILHQSNIEHLDITQKNQERAVTISDYESLIMQIYGNADLVKVVGGEQLSPPEYGKVFITIKPKVGECS